MITANEIRTQMKANEEKQANIAKMRAIAWCEGMVATCIKSAAIQDNATRIDLCATDLDRTACACAYDLLTEAGYKVRRNGTNFFTIEWGEG